jgi:hypothetical protein
MGIGHNFKIDNHYTNIDRWSIIGDNYLLNVFTDYNYSNSLISRVCLTKVKRSIKLHHIRPQTTIFVHLLWLLVILKYTDQNTTNLRKRTCWNISVKHICYNFSSFIQEYWDFIIGDFHQNKLLQVIHINVEQNSTLVSIYIYMCVLCNTWHKMDKFKL